MGLCVGQNSGKPGKHRLLYEFQSGVRASYSTDTCLNLLTAYNKLEQDKDNLTGTVLLDLHKACES